MVDGLNDKEQVGERLMVTAIVLESLEEPGLPPNSLTTLKVIWNVVPFGTDERS